MKLPHNFRPRPFLWEQPSQQEQRTMPALTLTMNGLLFVMVVLATVVGPLLAWVGFKAITGGLFGGFVLLPASVVTTVLAFDALGEGLLSLWMDTRDRPRAEVERVASRARRRAATMYWVGLYGVGAGLAILFIEFLNGLW